MEIGMIGAGKVAKAFARYLLKDGHKVILSNSREPESLRPVVAELGNGASAATPSLAAAVPVVLLAVPWWKNEEALDGLPNWQDRILIDATNPFVMKDGRFQIVDLGGRSASEIVAALAPGARVVKALNNVYVTNFEAGPSAGGGRRITFVSGDDAAAKELVGGLLSTIGFAVVDLGDLHTGGLIQQAGGPLAGLDLVKLG